ncbi:MAG: methyltransferase domain-containing protein [Promethearchaeota archaeon]|nr:MAG: methyltransferase domain-containing protein [Candidatus Lokiarchaeota archaeon]
MKKNTDKKRKKQEIIKNYNLTSDFYDKRYIKIQHEKYKLVFKNFELSNQIIMDAGCGTGLLFDYILNSSEQNFVANYHYIATDISSNMLKKFQSKFNQKSSHIKKRVHLILSDLENLPIRDNTLHSLFSFTSLQNLPNIFKGLKESFRVVRPEAEVYLSVLKKTLDLKKFKSRLQSSLKNMEIINKEFIEDIIFKGTALKE